MHLNLTRREQRKRARKIARWQEQRRRDARREHWSLGRWTLHRVCVGFCCLGALYVFGHVVAAVAGIR